MTITAANVEANGWVLALTLSATPGSFASYDLTPDATPKLALASVHAGFSPVAGVAVADFKTRALVGTRPLRKPAAVIGVTLQPAVIDETDMGGGQIVVRIALSEFIYASDSALQLVAIAGWRSGEGAQVIAVTNGSSLAVPVPILRWIDVPYQRNTNGQIKLSLMAFSHHPKGLAPVAAVRFTVTDGTNVKTGWTTALATSATYGDTTRAYELMIDVTGAPALTAGLLRCDAEVYPWIGAMRPTDGAGTKSMTALGTEAFKTAAASPFVVAYDPAGTRYAPAFVAIDPAGSGSAAAVTVGTSWAAAKAGTRASTLSVAMLAGYLANRSLAAANGQPAKSRSVDGMTFGFVAGTHAGPGNTSITSGITADECWPNVIGDPNEADPRSACILQTAAAAIAPRIARWRIANLTLQVGVNGLVLSAPTYWWFDNATIEGKAGSQTASTSITSVTPATGYASLYATRSRFWKYGVSWKYNGSGYRPALIRGCETTRRMEALAIVSNRWIEHLDAAISPASADQCTAGWSAGGVLTDLGAAEDFMVVNNDFRSSNQKIWVPSKASAAVAGTTMTSVRRQVLANNLCERKTTVTGANFWSCGENETVEISYNILEGNTCIGDRATFGFNDPDVATLAETDTKNNIAYGNRIANMAGDFTAQKGDDFDDVDSKNLRGGTHGYRPQGIGCWSILYGVGFEGNYDFSRHVSGGGWPFQYYGRNSAQYGTPNVGSDDKYAADYSAYGTGAGQGNYKPVAGSPLLGRGRNSNSDRDVFGNGRSVPFSAGAVDGETGTSNLVPANAVSASRAAVAPVGWSATLQAASARHPSIALSSVIGWFAALTPASAGSAMWAADAATGWAGALTPDAALHAQFASASAVETGEAVAVTLDPAAALHALSDSGPVLIPESIAAIVRTLIVSGELRIVFVPAG